MLRFPNIGCDRLGLGTVLVKPDRLEWRDKDSVPLKEIEGSSIISAAWLVFGSKAHLLIREKGETEVRFDGFVRSDFDQISKGLLNNYRVVLEPTSVSCEGANFGHVSLMSKSIAMKSTASKIMFSLPVSDVSQCVVPASNRDEVEIHFHEPEVLDREGDSLAQITFHFPAAEDVESESLAESFKTRVHESGIIRSVTGVVIAEFSKEQGNFISPRGKYAIQMMSTYLHLSGAQYSYKVKYEDIHSLFLLPKLDGGRMAFVISLDKPIRQGNQKYQHLIVETHNIEQTISINLTEDEMRDKYGGELTKTMTKPLSNLMAKIFKVLTQTIVYVPKHFISAREQSAVRCSLRANEGLLYPLAKSFIFIHKPTVIIKFEDIQYVEFQRFDPASNSATRNFDLHVALKANSNESKEYVFSSIDRSEYSSLHDFLSTRRLDVRIPEAAKRTIEDGLENFDSENESEDGDYEGGSESSQDSGSDSEDESGHDGESASPVKKRTLSEKVVAQKDVKDGHKKKRAKKDKDAPKGAKSSYIIFGNTIRDKIKEQLPGLSMIEITKEIGNRWKVLTKEEKSPYELMAKEDKQRFKAEMDVYNASKLSNSA